MSAICRSLSIALVCAAALWQSDIPSAQNARLSGELTAVVSVVSHGPPYPVSDRGSAGYVVYEREPFVVQVTLANDSDATVRTLDPQRGWLAATRIDLEGLRGEQSAIAVPFDVVRIVSRSAGGLVADPAMVASRERQEARIRLSSGAIPGPGTYRLRVVIDRAALSLSLGLPRVHLDATETVEIHSVADSHDRWNVLYSRSVEARFAGDTRAARDVVSQLIAAHPSSVSGWYELGVLSLEEGNCREAGEALQRVIGLIDSGADPTEISARRGIRGSLRQAIQRDIAVCATRR